MQVRGFTLALLLTTATMASAQSPGSTELSGFGRYTQADNTLGLQDKAGGGGSLSFFVVRNLALEAEAAYTKTYDALANTITNIPLRGRLSYHVPLGGNASSIRIGAGYVRNLYRSDVKVDDDGYTGIFGIRLGLTNHFGIRLDATGDYVRGPGPGRDDYVNLGGQAGFSVLMGNSTFSDKDKDGVEGRDDRCPGTPIGKSVDSAGCSASQRDSDRDKISDEQDGCPNTPAGEPVDMDGCAAGQKDADRDGVTDTADRCPATPAGQTVDNTGCVPPPPDGDKDGVPDGMDRCPATPAGEPVNPTGCPMQRDADIDGVPDNLDLCPASPRGEKVNENGCTILFQKQARSVVLRGVTFQTGKATLTPEARDILRDIASQLVENPQYRVQVSGHTDNTGSRAANLRLSLARARSVETFLEASGVPLSQVTAKGFGPDVPVDSNTSADGRAMNRRVELHRTN